MTKKTDYKRFEIIRGLGIIDNLTGELLMTLQDCCRVLNQTDERSNRVIEETYDEIYRLRFGVNLK